MAIRRTDSMKPLARMAWILAGLVIVAVLALYGIENLRGRAVLEETYADILVTKPIDFEIGRDDSFPAAEENFFGTPLLAGLTRITVDSDTSKDPWDRIRFSDSNSVERVESISLARGDTGRYGHFPKLVGLDAADGNVSGLESELEVWAAGFRSSGEFDVGDPLAPASRQILAAMDNRFGAELKELADAALRPHSKLTPHPALGGGLMPDPGTVASFQITGLKRLLTLRMGAAIAANDRELFHESCLIFIRLLEGLHPGAGGSDVLYLSSETPLLLDQISCGFRRGFWKKADLELLHQRLSGFRLHERIEGAFFASLGDRKAFFEEIRKRPGLLAAGYGSFSEVPIQARVAQVGPRGWIDMNAAGAIRWTHSVGIIPWQSRDFRSLPALAAKLPDFRQPGTYLMESQLFPGETFALRLAGLTVDWELTRLACLLEIHRLDTGAYPDTLAAAVDPVPLDPFNQKELIYRNDGDRFLLYSVGWNLRDDLGAVMRDRRSRLDRSVADWVWGEEDLLDADHTERRRQALAWIAMERELGRPVPESEFQATLSADSAEKDNPNLRRAREAELIREARKRIARDREAMGK